MIRFISLALLLITMVGCSDKERTLTGGSELSLSRNEKFRIISEKGESGDINKADEVASFLSDEENEVVGRACFNLGYLGARNYINQITGFLESDNSDLLVLCLSGLALMVDERDEYLFDQVIPLVSHDILLVRMSAIEVIGSLRSDKAQEILMRRFNDEAPAIQYEIVRALGKIGGDKSLPLLRSYQKEVEAMDHSVPRRGGTRGADPHPDVLEIAVKEAIASIEKVRQSL